MDERRTDERPARARKAKKGAERRKAARPSTIAREVLVPAEPSVVYGLFATAEGLSSWFCESAVVEARAGGRYDLAFSDKKLAGQVVRAEKDSKLSFTWGYGPGSTTRVDVSFERAAGGTRISLVESGFADGAEWDAWYLESSEGWAEVLAALVARVEGAPGAQRSCTLTERLEASPDEAWEAIGSAAGLSRWFASGGTLEEKAGGAYALQAGPSRIEGTVREHQPGRALSFTWQVWPCKRSNLPAPTVVSIALAAEAGGGTRVTLVHSGFGGGADWAGAMEEHAETWKFLLANLRSVVDRGVDRRRTRSIERSCTIAASPERVWAALTVPGDLERWECRKATATHDGESEGYRFDWGGGLFAECEVLASEPAKRLELGYSVLRETPGSEPEPCFAATHPTFVTFELERAGSGCKLTLVHSGFENDPAWDTYYQGHEECWDIDLEELVSLCETGDPGHVLRVAYTGAAPGSLDEPGSRIRVRAEGETVVITQAFPAKVDAAAVYARWRQRLERLARGPIQCGSDFNS